MPLMPRKNSKGSKVAYAILGKPANMVKQNLSEHEKYVRARLNFEESRLVR